jgi:hypothetical protein
MARRKSDEARKHCGPPSFVNLQPALVVIAVDLLEEGLGVKGARATGDASYDRKRNQDGQDGFHRISP